MGAKDVGAGGADSGVIAVRSELVHDQIISRLVGESLHRLDKGVPEASAAAADEALVAVCGAEATTADPGAESLASRIARAGYLERVVEAKMFERAQEPMPGLAERLADAKRDGSDFEAAQLTARALALEEPEGKPEPGSASWRVPGPGGHVRHFAALAIANELAASGDDADAVPPAPLDRQLVAKRCFIYGFYLRCCEEVAK